MKGVLLVANSLENAPAGGRAMLSRINHDVLRDICGDRLTVVELAKKPIRGLAALLNAFRGQIDGLDARTLDTTLRDIGAGNIGTVFVDGSNLGEFVRLVKTRFPGVRVYTFFHNVEVKFFWGSFRHSRTLHALGVALANYLAERKSVKYSDELICLSERDSRLLRTLYGRAATHVSAMAVRDLLPSDARRATGEGGRKYALFVGGPFYANRAGIAWFVKHVVPRVDIKICIVGKGFEEFREELQVPGKVEVLGAVDNLVEWYLKSHFVIAPIFDGSGMKTKVAEALMFGKKVIGTPEAFSGYEEVADRAGRVCRSAEEFAAAIKAADEMVVTPFDEELRHLYERNYSFSAVRQRLAGVLGY